VALNDDPPDGTMTQLACSYLRSSRILATMRKDGSTDWTLFRDSMRSRGVDPSEGIILWWADSVYGSRPAERIGWLMWRGTVFAFTAPVDVGALRASW
jgi:hypothetical protein